MAEPNWKNRTLFHRDNLEVLRGMNSDSVDLIATDPPFNKGRDFHATPDSLARGASFHDRWSWRKDVHDDWCDQIEDEHPHVWHVVQGSRQFYGDDMGAFLCYMAVRLLAMHRVLREHGSIYLHCDTTASHYLKEMMDAVFGGRNFHAEIVWQRTGAKALNPRRPVRNTDRILQYSKGGGGARNRLREIEGRGADDIIAHIPAVSSGSRERTGYPTQKPIALYERFILASSQEGDMVLDPFAGCATTCVAAELHGRQWAGIDIWDGARDVLLQRMEDAGLCAPKSGRPRAQCSFTWQQVHCTDRAPMRADAGEDAAPFLPTIEKFGEPGGRRMSRAEMKERLLEAHGSKCQGCDTVFRDHRYLELDHNAPRASGGIRHISNRILLCGPCNRLKSDTLTLQGLRKENRRRGYMADQREGPDGT